MCLHNCDYCLPCSMKMVQTNRHVFRISRSTSTAPAFNFTFYVFFLSTLRFTPLADGSCFLRLCFPLPTHCSAFCLPTLCIVLHLDDKRNFCVNNSARRFVVYLTGRPFHSDIALVSTVLLSTFQSIDWIENLIPFSSRVPTKVNLDSHELMKYSLQAETFRHTALVKIIN